MNSLFVRLDVEDWLTPASTWALERLVRLLEERGARVHWAVVGKKARQLVGGGHGHLLARMAATGVMGYHSWSHSEHPTLAEELEPLAPEAARIRFEERERPGVDFMARLGAPPRFFTQPGGNWVPEAVGPAGRALGFQAMLSESWNSYLVPTAGPMWYGGMLYWAPWVDLPKGLLFRLPQPDAQAEGVAALHAAWREGRPAVVVAHPTELVTAHFWDQDNFGGGRSHGPLRPGRTRPAAAWQPALDAVARMLDALLGSPGGVHWLTVEEWWDRALPASPTVLDREELTRVLTRDGLGPARLRCGAASAAELAWAMAWMEASGERRAAVPAVGAPTGSWPSGGAEGVLAAQAAWGHLPARVGGESLWEWASAAAQRVMGTGVCPAWRDAVRSPTAVHWDWPIFPPGFSAPRLLAEAERLAWTLKPVQLRV